MKKNLNILLIIITIILMSGCALDGKKVTECTLNSDQVANGYTMSSSYKISSSNDIVTKIKIEQVVKSQSKSILDYQEKSLKDQYKSLNDTYGGYKYSIKKDSDKVTAKVTVDYKKVDLNQYIKDNSEMKEYINDNNMLTLDGAKEIYESVGATCK